MKYLLDVCSSLNNFQSKLSELFIKYPSVDLKALGFPENWKMSPCGINSKMLDKSCESLLLRIIKKGQTEKFGLSFEVTHAGAESNRFIADLKLLAYLID